MAIAVHAHEALAELDRLVNEAIEKRAFELSQARGPGVGDPHVDWLSAEREFVWRPAIELAERNGAYVVEVALAGVTSKALEVTVSSDELLVRADVRHVHDARKGTIHVCEFAPGAAHRRVAFPGPIDSTLAKAEFRNGLLTVTAPKAKPRQARARTRGKR